MCNANTFTRVEIDRNECILHYTRRRYKIVRKIYDVQRKVKDVVSDNTEYVKRYR